MRNRLADFPLLETFPPLLGFTGQDDHWFQARPDYDAVHNNRTNESSEICIGTLAADR